MPLQTVARWRESRKVVPLESARTMTLIALLASAVPRLSVVRLASFQLVMCR